MCRVLQVKKKEKKKKKIIVYVVGAVVLITHSEAPNWLIKTNTYTCKFNVAPFHVISLNESRKIYNINTLLTLSGITI